MKSLNVVISVNIGKRIEALRTQQGMSQTELAKLVGTSQNTIFKIESGDTKRSGYFHDIAKALGTTSEKLMSGPDTPQPSLSPTQERLIRKIKSADEDELSEIEEALNAVLKIAEIKRRANEI